MHPDKIEVGKDYAYSHDKLLEPRYTHRVKVLEIEPGTDAWRRVRVKMPPALARPGRGEQWVANSSLLCLWPDVETERKKRAEREERRLAKQNARRDTHRAQADDLRRRLEALGFEKAISSLRGNTRQTVLELKLADQQAMEVVEALEAMRGRASSALSAQLDLD